MIHIHKYMIQILKWKDKHYLLLFDKFTRLRKRQPNKPPQISKHESGCDVISFMQILILELKLVRYDGKYIIIM